MRNNFERRNAQTSRKGWRPKKTSDKRLAEDIAESIRQNPNRLPTDYTSRPEIVAIINQMIQSK